MICALLAGLACASLAAAQDRRAEDSGSRSLQGVVTDAGDRPVPQAVVQLKDSKTLQIRSFITQQDGAYHFAGLSTNVEYEVKAEHNGDSSGSKTLGVFDSRKVATINLKLK